MNTEQCISVIEQEVDWHKNHRGESAKGDVWENGFIDGLKQAVFIMYKIKWETEKHNLDEDAS